MNSPVISRTLLALLAATSPLVAQEKMTVRTVLPTVSTATSSYELPGRTEPIEQATIFTRATGIVSERKYDIGDRVKAGEVLAVIATPEIDREVDAARAAVEQAASRAENARLAADRASNLLKTHAVSQEESEQRVSAAAETEAALRSAKADLARVEELQKFSTVTAPFNGTISAKNFDRGDRMRGDSSTAEGWLYRLSRLETLRFVISATPDLALRLSNESEASVRFTELPGRAFTAKLSRTSRVFDTASGTMRAEFLIENKDFVLPAGLTGLATFSLPPVAGTFLLPTNTLIVRQGKSMVATLKEGKVHYVEVLAGKNSGPTLEIISAALTPEAPVIVNPNALLREGDAVDVAK
ncbi:MAG: efflux RND transporter periplasmic adaptor subunit [Luteolibacter sp.]|uniref:efflux RND transporter periplasmic adaptor subunit n=1 Tax=Luteolibacter sp. TaxID=1962973 RepID=UPI0032673022